MQGDQPFHGPLNEGGRLYPGRLNKAMAVHKQQNEPTRKWAITSDSELSAATLENIHLRHRRWPQCHQLVSVAKESIVMTVCGTRRAHVSPAIEEQHYAQGNLE